MSRKLTITLSDDVYEGLCRQIGAQRIGQYLEALARPHIVQTDLELAYREAAADSAAEQEAHDWIESDLDETFHNAAR